MGNGVGLRTIYESYTKISRPAGYLIPSAQSRISLSR